MPLFLVPWWVLCLLYFVQLPEQSVLKKKENVTEQNQSLPQKMIYSRVTKSANGRTKNAHTHTLTYKTQSRSSMQVNSQLLKTSSRKCRAQKDCIRGLYKTVQIHVTGDGIQGRVPLFSRKSLSLLKWGVFFPKIPTVKIIIGLLNAFPN